jgi:hypothetical protein
MMMKPRSTMTLRGLFEEEVGSPERRPGPRAIGSLGALFDNPFELERSRSFESQIDIRNTAHL